MFPLVDVLLRRPRVHVIDVGAFLPSGSSPAYEKLMRSADLDVFGLEGLAGEAERLQRELGRTGREYAACVLGDGSSGTFHVCALESMSSLLRPNLDLSSEFAGLGEYLQVCQEVEVTTQTLDEVAAGRLVDHLELDVQGAELDVLRGAPEVLSRAVSVEVEVKFFEQYTGQPTFGNIDEELRRHGFSFHMFPGYGTRPLATSFTGGSARRGFRQWLWSDAVYLRSFRTWDELPPAKLLALAVILHEMYASYDFAHRALLNHDAIEGTAYAGPYLSLLTEVLSPAG